jgi:hypothetical protein
MGCGLTEALGQLLLRRRPLAALRIATLPSDIALAQ